MMRYFKHYVAAMLWLLAGHSLWAQQALWGGAPTVSPEIHENRTVTFRLKAPKATTVGLTGDFLPPSKIKTDRGEVNGPGYVELTRGQDSVWSFTTPEPLAPELYSYAFMVDGVRVNDPSNVYLNRDVSTLSNIFIIGGGRADLYRVNRVPHGTVSRMWYDSPGLGMSRRVTVYTPPGYEAGTDRYPVFYLLHGMGGDEEAWMALGRTAQIMDNLIAAGKAKPMIVVMTNGNAAQEAAPGESSLGLEAQPGMQLPKTMDGSFEQAFPDVVKFVDSRFRTLADKQHRAIAGLSMGGFHSLHISKQYPDMFDYIGLFSAAIRPRSGAQSPIYDDFEGKLKRQFDARPALYWIAIGKTDFLYDANTEYRALLDRHKYPYIYFENEDGHIWRNWRIYLTEFVPQLFGRLH